LKLSGCCEDRAEAEQDDDGADERREVGIDTLDADLGEDRRQRGEYRGEYGPELPG
jgi:hypothetical protein